MNSEHQVSWHRHIVFDPMNAHSQADDPALTYVMQFNADEREWQENRLQALALGMSSDQKRSRRMRGVKQARRGG
jgi:hypothetical protein